MVTASVSTASSMIETFSSGKIDGELKEQVIIMLKELSIPYILSPGEAEAQCYKLEKDGHCDYIATNDSDIFAYGGQHIVKNFMVSGEQMELFQGNELQFTQDQVIIYSLLVGNDYTNGIKGIGKKRAEKVVSLFESIEEFAEFVTCYTKDSLKNWNIKQSSIINESSKQMEYYSNLQFVLLYYYLYHFL